MKRTIITLLILISASIIFGQTNKRTNAYNYWRYGKLDLAKQEIDEAIKNEKTIMDPKTWYYRGNIYYDIAISKDPKYSNLDPDPFGVAFASYQKAKELDTKGEFKEDIQKFTIAVGEGYYNVGVLNYNEKKFKEAAQSFDQSYQVSKSVGRTDTTALYNAAVSASQANEIKMAKQFYQQLLEIGMQKPDVYSSMADLYKADGDTAMALQVVAKGRAIYPEDFNLLIAETNIYLATSERDKAMKDLEEALKFDKTNPSIFFAVGTIYDQIGDIPQAISAYDNAILLKPDYFEANYNMGALYVNQAANLIDTANALPLEKVKEYEVLKAKADDMLKKAVPYLEKSHELMPADVNTMVSLKEIYTRLGMADKLKAINEQLNK